MPTRPLASTRWETDLDAHPRQRVSTLLRAAEGLLAEAGIANPAPDASTLLAHAWGVDTQTLSRRRLFDEEVPAEVAGDFARLCERRRQRVPLQHLTGTAHFRHLELSVGPGVFVPRPETELLVTEVLEELKSRAEGAAPLVIDLCSGSGAISLSLASEHPGVRVIGVERERTALEWSRTNLERTHLGDSSVDFVEGDATTFADDTPALHGCADVVVTNPPYVPDAALPRDAEVREHDPAAALYGGSTGLEIPAQIILQAEMLLRPGGLFIMEHSEEQGEGARDLISSTASLRQAATFPDYTGRDRYTVARRAPETNL